MANSIGQRAGDQTGKTADEGWESSSERRETLRQSDREERAVRVVATGKDGANSVADTNGTRGGEGGISSQRTNGSKFVSNGQAGGVDLADSKDFRLQRPSETRDTFPQRTQPDDEQSYGCDSAHVGIWPAEPRLGRVVNGCANRVDRIRLLGNGVVPQCAGKAWAVLSEELLGS